MVVGLWNACGLIAPPNDARCDFRFARDKPGSDVLVGVLCDGTIVGTVMVGHDGHRGWLYYVAVLPEAQRQGVGRAMVEAAERWLAIRDVEKAHLLVRDTNLAVVAFYERLGFTTAPRVLMQKRFREPRR